MKFEELATELREAWKEYYGGSGITGAHFRLDTAIHEAAQRLESLAWADEDDRTKLNQGRESNEG